MKGARAWAEGAAGTTTTGREGGGLLPVGNSAPPHPRPACYPSRCPPREDFPLIETEDEAYLRRIKSKSVHRTH